MQLKKRSRIRHDMMSLMDQTSRALTVSSIHLHLLLAHNIHQFLKEYESYFKKHPRKLEKLKKKYREIHYQIANDFKQISREFYISLKDVLNININQVPSSHTRCAEYSNKIYHLVVSEILSFKESIDERTLTLELWIAVMKNSFDEGDYQTALSILGALNDASIKRLEATFMGLSAEARRIKEEIEQFADAEKYLLLADNREKLVIHYLSPYKHHITKIVESLNKFKEQRDNAIKNCDLETAKKIHFKIYSLDSKLKIYKKEIESNQVELKYKFPKSKNHKFLKMELMNQAFSDQKDQFLQSLKMEPRGSQIEPSTIFRSFPHITFDSETKLKISDSVQSYIDVENLNDKLRDSLRDLDRYSESISDLDKEKHAYLGSINEILLPMTDYLADRSNKGCVPKLENIILILDNMINYPKRGADEKVVALLYYIKQLLEIQKKLSKKLNKIKRKSTGEIIPLEGALPPLPIIELNPSMPMVEIVKNSNFLSKDSLLNAKHELNMSSADPDGLLSDGALGEEDISENVIITRIEKKTIEELPIQPISVRQRSKSSTTTMMKVMTMEKGDLGESPRVMLRAKSENAEVYFRAKKSTGDFGAISGTPKRRSVRDLIDQFDQDKKNTSQVVLTKKKGF